MLAAWVTASAGGAYSGDLAGTPASDAKDLTKAITTFCTDMKELFKDKTTFNSDISTWDVSNVTTMEGMFEGAEKFNKDVSKWDTNKVENMDKMFKNATEFKQDLSKWCVINLTTEPTDFTEGSACEEDKKPVWGTWSENPYLGNWVLDSYTVYGQSMNVGGLEVQDKSIFDPYLVEIDNLGNKTQYMICEDYELVSMQVGGLDFEFQGEANVGKYQRQFQLCNLDGSKRELRNNDGYWTYDTENEAIYADETYVDLFNLMVREDFRIDVNYTSDKNYFYAGQWDVMNYGPQAGLEVYIVEVYKRVL
jgi:surface protein